ncbi:response regulator transcription factor [Alphaproteobacteria bacterium]|jgi:DNA-binding response OmpR family regulator|nr:response regulator transcription factor [Alphaproteobacteria bacterium]
MPGMKVLIVDDDEALRSSLEEQLQLHEEFVTHAVGTAKEALGELKDAYFDIILLDIELPDMDSLDVCHLLRRNGVSSPIIMLTRANSDVNRFLDFDAGAIDCISKPFRLGVLLARLRAHLSQHENSSDAVFVIGPYKFMPSQKILIGDSRNKKIHLTEKETSILQYLHRAGDKIVSRETLLGEVWGYNAGVTTHTLETHVYRLRQKIESEPSKARIIVTEPGGYRLIT